MAFLNAQQRADLRQELLNLKRFNKAKGRVRGMDEHSRLAFYRNAQQSGRLQTRYDLPTLGARVTLTEHVDEIDQGGKLKAEYNLLDVTVEALAGNNS